jgi:hypothetical protein
MRKLNLKIFFIATFIVILLNFLCWNGLEAYQMQYRSHPFLMAVGSMWTVLRFPFFTLFWRFIYSINNFFIYSTVVFLNCAFYGIIIERIFSLRNKSSKFPPVRTTYTVVRKRITMFIKKLFTLGITHV